MTAQSKTPQPGPREREAARFTTGALFKRWSIHFAVAIVVAAVAFLYQRHPLLGGDEQDLTTEQLLGDISFAFAPGGWNADSNPPGTTTYTMPGGACELTITGTYQVTKARLALLCSPADLRRLAAQDRLLVQSGTLSMSPHRSGDGAGPAEHAVAAKFVNNSIREKDRQAAFDFLEAELRRFADDPTAAPSIRIFGRRRLTAEYHDGWFILSLKP